MTGLQLTLLVVVGVGAVLFAAFPKRPRIGKAYCRYAFLVLVSIVFLAPFAWLFAAAFKDPSALMKHLFLPPPSEWSRETLNLSNFRVLFEPDPTPQGDVPFWRYIANSLFLASTATCIQLFFCSLAGFALAKYNFRGRQAIMVFMLGSMVIPHILFLAPVYELIFKLGWIDTYWALLIPNAASVFGIFLFRQAIIGIPDDLLAAGRMDGCGEFRIYLQIIMPLVRPMSAAFCLVVFLGMWNSFISPQIYLHTQAKLPLPVILNQYVGVYSRQYGVFLAGTALAIIPPAILFFSLQREFISGLTSGAVKG